jgi:hypothetical protein
VKVQVGPVGAVRWVLWGPEMASVAGRLLLPPPLGKSHRMLRQVPKQVWKLCGKIKDWFPKISVCFSYFHFPPFA